MLHDISLKSNEPINVKQLKISDADQDIVANHVKQWLKLGAVQPTRSKYNSPIFVDLCGVKERWRSQNSARSQKAQCSVTRRQVFHEGYH